VNECVSIVRHGAILNGMIADSMDLMVTVFAFMSELVLEVGRVTGQESVPVLLNPHHQPEPHDGTHRLSAILVDGLGVVKLQTLELYSVTTTSHAPGLHHVGADAKARGGGGQLKIPSSGPRKVSRHCE